MRPPKTIVGQMHTWFESMRLSDGYGGPVSHWWRHCRLYTGAGLDWRYEGLIHGYLNLYATTGEERWLETASTAGRDLVTGQLSNGNYRASAFERNPEFGGTPHEACASGVLVRLARVSRDANRDWEPFARTAQRNLQWHLDALWRSSATTFSDTVGMDSYVPNKIASTAEAILEFAQLTGDETLLERVVVPAAEAILELQITNGAHRGAIHQMCTGAPNTGGDGKFFPLYIARCIPPLLAVADATGKDRFRAAAVRAGEFLSRVQRDEGSFPQVVYASGNRNVNPRWIAGVGDILRAYDALDARGHNVEMSPVEEWLLAGFDDCGAFRTANGFGHIDSGHQQLTFEDVLHVVGWNDKAFRWLTTQVTSVEVGVPATTSIECRFENTPGQYVEDADRVEFMADEHAERMYRWDKESRWGTIA